MSTQRDPAELLRTVRKALESTARDFDSAPFFVRPMVKRGFARRTGKSLDEWSRHIASAIAKVEGGGDAHYLLGDLEGLAEYFRGAPERAKKAMRGAPLEAITARSREREKVVRAAIEGLRPLSS